MSFDATRLQISPGTLYVAALGTTEPTAVSGAWPSGWTEIGYTDQGSEFDFQISAAAVEVEEEIWPVKQAITGASASMTFALVEQTRANLALVLNAGVSTDIDSDSQGVNPDGSLWQEAPALGSETRVMVGWDALPEGSAQSANVSSEMRIIARQCLQTGGIKRVARKGNNKSLWNATFTLEKPTGVQPFRVIFPAVLDS